MVIEIIEENARLNMIKRVYVHVYNAAIVQTAHRRA